MQDVGNTLLASVYI